MNFDLTDRQKEMKKELATWLNQAFQDDILFHKSELSAQKDLIRTFLQKLAGLPFYFQTGLDPNPAKTSPYSEALTWVLHAEEMALLSPSLCLTAETSSRLFGWMIARYGNEKQLRDFLTPLQKGQLIGAVTMAESSGNFSEKGFETEAQKEGNGYRIKGCKKMVINAPLADCLAIPGKLNDQLAFFLIKAGQPGLMIGESLETLGFKDLVMADVTLNHCLVPEDQIIGPFTHPAPWAELQVRSNLIITVASLGVMMRALQGAKRYSAESPEGRKPAQAYQEIRFKLAEMFTLYQTAQWMLYRAAWMLETLAPEAETVAAATKIFVTEAAEEVARAAMQIMAGEGYLSNNKIEECFRDARFGPVAGDTSEVLRMRIAEDCLQKYR